MKHFINVFAFCMVAVGLWQHDWRIILASLAVVMIWPLIGTDVESVAHEEQLDKPWGEDEC